MSGVPCLEHERTDTIQPIDPVRRCLQSLQPFGQFYYQARPGGPVPFCATAGETGGTETSRTVLHRQGTKSIILIWNGRIYERSGAALRIAGQLKGPVKCLYVFLCGTGFYPGCRI